MKLRFSVRTLLVLVTLCATCIGGKLAWDYYANLKIARPWIELAMKSPTAPHDSHELASDFQCPEELEPDQQLAILLFAAKNLETSAERLCALEILVHNFPSDCEKTLMAIIRTAPDPNVRAAALRCLAFIPKADLGVFQEGFDDYDASVRAAAIDASTVMSTRAWRVSTILHPEVPNARPISVSRMVQIMYDTGYLSSFNGQMAPTVQALQADQWSERVHSQIASRLVTPTDIREREAAARALVESPPANYQLRVAEWGVWINTDSNLELVQAVLDEIPPFVHRVARPREDFANFVEIFVPVTKPIIHLTVDQPMAVEIDAAIRMGEPWFAFPQPDRFSRRTLARQEDALKTVAESNQPDSSLALPISKTVPAPTQFSWLAYEQHAGKRRSTIEEKIQKVLPTDSPTELKRFGSYVDIGVTWQSLIVTPALPSWASVPEVDSEFAWWQSLREEVPSSWVTSNGETERFLYYDGPTRLPAPLFVAFSNGKLIISPPKPHSKEVARWGQFDRYQRIPPANRIDAIFIDNSVEPGQCFILPKISSGSFTIAELAPLSIEKGKEKLLAIAVQQGLTEDEAKGLLLSWESGFFDTPGKQLVSFLTRQQYDDYCPIRVRPRPTEMERVGIVLSPIPE